MGVAATHPCHACNVDKESQCVIARDKNIQEVMRDYGSLLIKILHGCDVRHCFNDLTAARKLQTQSGFYNLYLPPSMWSKFFDPTKQTPPCLMHNGPLGLIRTMLLQFADVHGSAFVDHVNDATSSNHKFPGVPRAPHGIFCKSTTAGAGGNRRRYTLRKLNADQLMGFARSSVSFIWQVLPKAHFCLWMLILRWISTLYAREFCRDDLDCGGNEVSVCTRGDDRLCIRHMGRHVVVQWLDVFGHQDLQHH
jgi:hypothetical protein